jgi:hypothetical protein
MACFVIKIPLESVFGKCVRTHSNFFSATNSFHGGTRDTHPPQNHQLAHVERTIVCGQL